MLGLATLGILAAKKGATSVLGTDIADRAIFCAKQNIALNNVEKTAVMMQGDGLSFLLPAYKGHFDLILASTPWSTISQAGFDAISDDKKILSRAFYDVEDVLISDVLSKGPSLVSPNGNIFITASLRIMDRIKRLCKLHNVSYKIVKEKDIHRDGNIHYILVVW
jgi:23S rRNA G2069 N7-methylase RlmK/C1962 C5-methylase RlmI